MIEWTTDAPTSKSGWYWAIDRDGEVMMVHYEMSPFGGSDFITTVGDDEYLRHYDWQDFTHWKGPIPKPEPPRDDVANAEAIKQEIAGFEVTYNITSEEFLLMHAQRKTGHIPHANVWASLLRAQPEPPRDF